ncbi:dTMP kinase [Candidatus Phytoplasma phoenicium]|uniref:Thymidylate kinase n=1 Tax=Candidatus Phytoplasma phoenicium TaxID=198422 RepID=A0A0L0MKD8_9MOLU|nr:dTMP kinase [Candidatus Phytoplasma phoenicium]KND62760.1 Thymidylate kinase [Candidatus Phytoplasma phoenicium]
MFISFEGCEGSGKTTLSIALFQKLSSMSYPILLTKEPGGSNFNLDIKQILLKFYNQIDFRTEALLYAADRTEHLKNVILPALDKTKIVICDRYLDSSLVYQGYVRGLGDEFIRTINPLACQNLPDITFYLDLDPKIGLQRIRTQRSQQMDFFDLQNLTFHQKIREGYLQIVKQFPQRICVIDAQQPLTLIQKNIENKIEKLFQIKL